MNEQIITETHIYLDYTSGKFYNVLLTKYIGTCTLQEIKDKIDKTSKYTFPYTKFLQKMSVVSIIWQTIHVHKINLTDAKQTNLIVNLKKYRYYLPC